MYAASCMVYPGSSLALNKCSISSSENASKVDYHLLCATCEVGQLPHLSVLTIHGGHV